MRARLLRALTASGVVALASVGLVSAFSGSPAAPATTQTEGNVTTCADVGFASSTQVAGSGDSNLDISASGSSITISNVGAGVVIDAVAVKGGPIANVYSPGGEGTFSTPTNPNNGQPYGLSHYFVCYHIEEVTTTQPTPTTGAVPPTTAGTQTVTPQPQPQVAPQGVQRAPAGVQV